MVIKSDGNVGIGKTNPGSALDVVGDVVISGRIECIGTTGISLGGGTTAQRPTYAPPGTIRYNSTIGYMEVYTGSGWGALATPPTVTGVSPASVAVADTATQVFTVSGASFDTGLAINLVGADGTNYEVVDSTFVNAATTTFKMGDLSSATAQLANRPYTVKITGGSGLAATSTQTIGLGGAWISPAAGATLTFLTTASVSKTLAGTDAAGGTSGRTFAVAPGSTLPSGLSLNASSGVISGTIGAANSGTNVTFRVVDTPSQSFVERTFSIAGVTPLYSFSSHTFTNAGKTGQYGPTLAQLRTAYSPTWTDNTNYLNVVTQGIQNWAVPETGTYQINAVGASGGQGQYGNYTTSPWRGSGARMRGSFTLTKGDSIKILVGQEGTTGGGLRVGSGGGGSYVVRTPYNTNASILVIAGGGGGGYPTTVGQGSNAASGDAHASITSYGHSGFNGQNASNNTSSGGSQVGNGGTSGNGGYIGRLSGGGGGFFTNGYDATSDSYSNTGRGGSAFVNGGVGGGGNSGGGSFACTGHPLGVVNGGFGGGGGASYAANGAGGGYSGGGGANGCNPGTGGGGGSINNGTDQLNTYNYNTGGHGYVVITKL